MPMIQSRNAAFAEESAEVEVLFAMVAKFEVISKKIKTSLTKLESGGQIVKDSIKPVHSDTQSLQTMNHNVDGILVVIDKMLAPSEDMGREERVIRAGPGKVGLPDYLASLHRIERVLSQMTSINLRVNQKTVGDYNELLSTGINQLQNLFTSVLTSKVQTVEPLHYITKQLHFPTLSQDAIAHLRSIDAFLSSPVARDATNNHRKSPSVRIYAEICGPYLSNSLQNLATASITTSKKKSAPDELYRQGTSGIGIYASGMEGIFIAEYQNITGIFLRENWSAAFESVCRKALNNFAKTVLELNRHIKSNMSTDCFLAYEILEIISGLSSRLDSKTGELKLLFADAMKPIRETAKSSVFELIDDVRRRAQSISTISGDAASLALTGEVMARLQALTLYQRPLASILASIGDGNWRTTSSSATGSSKSLPSLKSFDVGADWSQLLAHFVLDTIETLLTTIEAKARTFLKNKSIIGIFMANNVAIIDRMIRSSDLSTILSSPGAPPKIESWRKQGLQAYTSMWHEPSSHLLDVQYTNRGARPPSGGSTGFVDSAAIIKGLSSKEKEGIKGKFKDFNASFDDLSARHRALFMEKEVRSQTGRDVQGLVEPLYARFWDRYHDIDKGKGKGKYVKYDKGSLSAQLANLG